MDSGPRALAIDADNNVWIGGYGKHMGYYDYGYWGRGVAIGFDGDVWVANSYYNRVTRHDPSNGNIKGTIIVGAYPTGVAIDSAGKVWVTNYTGDSIQRIDPATNIIDFTQGGATALTITAT